MMLFSKPGLWAQIYSVILVLSVSFTLIDNFVIQKPGQSSQNLASSSSSISASSSSSISVSTSREPIITDRTYEDDNLTISIETLRLFNTNVHVATIWVREISYLKTAFAYDTYGRNYNQKTSVIATNHNALFAVNGDYYGYRDVGFVVRNSILYRSVPRTSGSDESLLLDETGLLRKINERTTSRTDLAALGAYQIWSFGPFLILNSLLQVNASSKVPYEMESNPRTAIGQIDEHQFVFIVSDGRTTTNEGLSLLELAQVFQFMGCVTAYNLDGGGSATMWFNGQIVNYPVNHGSTFDERSISDIIYIGY